MITEDKVQKVKSIADDHNTTLNNEDPDQDAPIVIQTDVK